MNTLMCSNDTIQKYFATLDYAAIFNNFLTFSEKVRAS